MDSAYNVQEQNPGAGSAHWDQLTALTPEISEGGSLHHREALKPCWELRVRPPGPGAMAEVPEGVNWSLKEMPGEMAQSVTLTL